MAKFLDSNGVTHLVGLLDGRYKALDWQPAATTLASLGVTATATELNILDGATISTAELNYLDNVTSNIQTQLNGKQAKLTAGTGISISGATISCTLDTTIYKVVDELPESPASGDENKIHLVPDDNGSGQNVYVEYLWTGTKWETLGEAAASIDIPLANITDLNSGWDALLKAAPSKYVTGPDDWGEITGKPTEFTPANHASSKVTSLTGYTIASGASEIAATDSLNTALGKLQASINGKAASSHTHAITAITGLGTGWSGILTTAAASCNLANIVTLVGYTQGTTSTAVAATDTINAAIAKLQNQINTKANSDDIPEIPNISVANGTAESGKYISAIAASGHAITVTKASLPTSVANATTANKVANSLTLEVSTTKDSSTSVTFNGSAATTFTIGIMSDSDIESAVAAAVAGA